MPFKLMVADNYHYMDPDEVAGGETFETLEGAIEAAKAIVDGFLKTGYSPGMKADALFRGYTMYGEDPFIVVPGSGKVPFSAWDYARKRCEELCTGDAGKG